MLDTGVTLLIHLICYKFNQNNMPTLKQRINITVSADTGWALKKLAKMHQVPIATKAGELLEQALELEEDLIWAEIAEKRSKEKVKYIPHEIVWKSIK